MTVLKDSVTGHCEVSYLNSWLTAHGESRVSTVASIYFCNGHNVVFTETKSIQIQTFPTDAVTFIVDSNFNGELIVSVTQIQEHGQK